ncbi:nicotinate (nicotinamide) nucleotide adenylyltransferase [Rhodohalobacter mucosus]|nr:nicotinate (nicotinamide) nucleotide adenylyltransferase [Rhodohalobacter mucosus]
MMKRRVGIFGGTFDPVHSGHIEAVHSFLESGLIDEVWVMLTPDPPHKRHRSKHTPYKHRLRMLELAFSETERVKICTLERELPQPSYTLQTLQHLTTTYPDTRFFLCLGEDSVSSFHTWHRYRDILSDFSLMAVKRPGSDAVEAEDEVLEKTIFLEHKPVDISSTAIRQNGSDMEQMVPDTVAAYMEEHELYT